MKSLRKNKVKYDHLVQITLTKAYGDYLSQIVFMEGTSRSSYCRRVIKDFFSISDGKWSAIEKMDDQKKKHTFSVEIMVTEKEYKRLARYAKKRRTSIAKCSRFIIMGYLYCIKE